MRGGGGGKLVGTSTGEALYDAAAVRGGAGLAAGRLRATDSGHPLLAAAAADLAAEGWPGERTGRGTHARGGYEFASRRLTSRGLDWLVVVGINITCSAGRVWKPRLGHCQVGRGRSAALAAAPCSRLPP